MTPATRKPPAVDERPLLSTAQVADRLGVSEQHVRRLVSDGDLDTVDIGRRGAATRRPKLRFHQADVEALLARRTYKAGQPAGSTVHTGGRAR